MADNFLENGYKLYVWNRIPEKAKDLVRVRAILYKSPKEVANSLDTPMLDDVSSRYHDLLDAGKAQIDWTNVYD